MEAVDHKKLIDLILAKSNGKTLVGHLGDAVIEALRLMKFVEKNNIKLPIGKIFTSNRDFFKSLMIAASLHDLGKILYSFQREVYKSNKFPNELKIFLKPTRNFQGSRHEFFSALWSIILLRNNGTDVCGVIRSAILLHHYNKMYSRGVIYLSDIIDYYLEEDAVEYIKFIDENRETFSSILKEMISRIVDRVEKEEQLKNYKSFLEESLRELDLKLEYINEVLEKMNNGVDLENFNFYSPEVGREKESKNLEFLFFLGSLRRCDYSSSGDVNIEMFDKALTEIFENASRRIEDKIKSKGGANWQEKILKKDAPKHLILVAPTGSGKTEFSILWASKQRNKKLLYTLPLRVALNDLFFRFRGISGQKFKGAKMKEEEGYFASKEVGLSHSTAYSEYIKEENYSKDINIEKKIDSAKVLSQPVILSTPDQILLTSLNYYGSDKVLSVYPLSALVLDEIQTYNAEMAAIIIKSIQTAIKLGSPVLVMTATYPPYFETFFEDEMDFKRIDVEKEVGKVKNKNLRHKIEIEEELMFKYNPFEMSNKVEEIIKNHKSHNSWLVIVNNVRKAVYLYKKLKDKKELKKEFKENIFLLHSRLIEKRKEEVINQVKKRLGEKERVVLIATQIVEASVDFDFDALITEISPIDSQVQRWGRIYRNRGEKDYNGKDPNIFIFTGKEADKIDLGTEAIYDPILAKITGRILRNYQGKVLGYQQEKELVRIVFEEKDPTDGKSVKEKYEEKIRKLLKNLDYFTVEKKSEAQKIFRRIAGVQVVLPRLMIEVKEDDLTRKIGNSILSYVKDGTDPTWEEIVKRIFGENEKEIKNKKYSIKNIINNFSVNIPIFFLDEFKYKLKNFKGYYIFPFSLSEEVYELGISKFTIGELKKWEEDYLNQVII